MADAFGDAFHEEREIKVYGRDVTESRSIFSYSDLSDAPECKSNNVSFMKVEELNDSCRNLLLTSDSYVCYSVTQKKNVMRVIDTITGEKTILRGHESAILDMAISPADHGVFCSVDNGTSLSAAHIFVWTKSTDGFSFTNTAQFPQSASTIEAHPTVPHLWAIAEKGDVTILSSSKIQATDPICYHFDQGVVTGLSFSADGLSLLAAVQITDQQSVLQILRIQLNGTLAPVFNDYASMIKLENVTAIRCLETCFLAVTRADKLSFNFDNRSSGDHDYAYYEIRAYSLVGEQPANKAIQTILFSLPLHKSPSGKVSSSLKNAVLDCALGLEPRKSRFAILASRRSDFVVVLGVQPAAARLPIHHLTLLNLRAPVVSQSISTILGREHHSYVEDEYLEVSAYQEEAAEQASIQQYHVHLQQVLPAGPTPTSSTPKEKSNTILGLLQSMSGASSPAVAAATAVAAPVATAAAPTISAPPPAPASPAVGPSPSAMSTLRDVAPPSDTSPINNTSLSALRPIGSKSKLVDLGADSPSALPAASAVSASDLTTMSVDNASLQSLRKDVLDGDSVKLKKLDGAKLFAAPAAATVVAPATAAAADLPAFLAQSSVKSTPILQMLKPKAASSVPASGTSKVIPPLVPALPALVPAASTASAPALVVPPMAGTAVPVVVSVSSENTPFTPVAIRPPASTPTSARTHFVSDETVKLSATVDQMHRSFSESIHMLTQEVMRQQKPAAASSAPAMSASDLLVVKEEVMKEWTKAQAKTSSQLAAQIKAAAEQESKKVLELLAAQKQELAAQFQDSVAGQMPALVAKVKEITRESVKQSLPPSFKASFDAAIIPAFQAATDRMFSQLSSGFDEGMRNLSSDYQQVLLAQQQSQLALQREVSELKSTVQQLAAAVQQLVAQPPAAVAAVTPPNTPSPADLVRAGRVSEGVRQALDAKDIDTMLSVLALLTPPQVTQQCSHLTRLCITQQLAADMSESMPKEGLGSRVEWIKSLVLSLLNIPIRAGNAEDASFERHFKSMIGVVLESIKSAQDMIMQSQFDNGEDCEDSVVIPQSASTDLQLLQCLIQTKI